MLPDTINIVLNKEIFEQSSGYHSPLKCPVTTAVKKLFPNYRISTALGSVSVGTSRYLLHEENWNYEIYTWLYKAIQNEPETALFLSLFKDESWEDMK